MLKEILLLLVIISSALSAFEEINIDKINLKEKIGHLFMIGVYQDRPLEELKLYLNEYQISNLLFVGRGWKPERQREIILELLKEGDFLFAEDLEYGLAHRMEGVVNFPRNMTLGAIQEPSLIYELGKEVGRECRAIGISLNLSPVVDVNSNPLNPAIGKRSFGDDPVKVAHYGTQMMKGLQTSGIKTCAKHFPGHGDVTINSHDALPTTESYSLYPFKTLIDEGVDCVLTAHLIIPSIDPENPASLSKTWIDILKNDLHFEGIILTDDLLMKAIEPPYSDVALKAFLAGNHILLFTENYPHNRSAFVEAYNALYTAFSTGSLPLSLLDERVAQIRAFKSKLALKPTCEPWNTDYAVHLKNRLFREAITKITPHSIEEPFQVLTTPYEPIYGKTLIFAGSPYLLPLLPHDRALILAYEPEGVEQALVAIRENRFRGRLPVKITTSSSGSSSPSAGLARSHN